MRTRVRVVPSGLEVREFRTRTYAWSTITDVRVDRWSGNRTIRITLLDGVTKTLPAPVASSRPRDSDDTLALAVAAIESRLPANRGAVAVEAPVPLDDLLHEDHRSGRSGS